MARANEPPLKLRFPSAGSLDQSIDAMSKFLISVSRVPQDKSVLLDFSSCRELKPLGVVVLAGVHRALRNRGIRCFVQLETMIPPVMERMLLSGCGNHLFEMALQEGSGLFRHDITENHDSVIDYLQTEWLAGAGITMSPDARNLFISKVYEIYANAFEHGASLAGVFTSGERARDTETMILTVADFGPGIPHNAASALNNPLVSGADAMRWAFELGTTTSLNQRYPRGLGLDLLKEFVRLNGGAIDIYSHQGHGRVARDVELFRTLPTPFRATVVQIEVKCNNEHYVLTRELDNIPQDAPIF